MNIVFKISTIRIQNKEFPFETEFDSMDLNHNLMEELRNEILAQLAGVEYVKDDDDDNDTPLEQQIKRGPGRPRKNA